MLKWLLKFLLILIVLVLASVTLPLASFWLVRDPVGGQLFFWLSPWMLAPVLNGAIPAGLGSAIWLPN